ncbi:MAG TPA: glucans biosynthesis glucosyltransferase MdoH [Casimicrobiaceae bacterium]
MELHPAPRVDGASELAGGVVRYLDRFKLAPEQRRVLVERNGEDTTAGRDGIRASMMGLHRSLAGGQIDPDNPALASIRRRLEFAYGPTDAAHPPPLTRDALGRDRLVTAPPLTRTSMVPRAWPRGLLMKSFLRFARRDEPPSSAAGGPQAEGVKPARRPERRQDWRRAATFRRLVLMGLIVSQTYIASNFMVAVLPYHGRQPLEIAILVLFAILFGWVSAGFWTAMAGFVLLVFGTDRYAITSGGAHDAPLDPKARVAIVMPICNETVSRVFAGLTASYESLARTGELEHFDFFVLSDSNNPDIRVAELDAWATMCRAVDGFGRIFYRWRQHRIKRKSGNIADFCRRWGSRYRYMVVLDADSIMTGTCLTTLLRLIEGNPDVGIVQTAPHAAGRETLYARVQQFATSVYGPLFTAGLHFWQLGESHYWGHNAIIRVAPFMQHCALGRLPGHGTLSGEILSHDFVEAALMRRAGWQVMIAYDLAGSYEEMPPNLVDELTRDRRWCRGNLMNFRLFLMRGLHAAHRAVFMSGVMAYLSALLWFISLILSTALLAVHTLSTPRYFTEPFQLFPLWPEWHPEWAIALFSATAILLFLPKVLGALLIMVRGAADYGGSARLAIGLLGEFWISALLAPIRMLFHSQFVVGAFVGWAIQWKSPAREDAETTWREALRRHGAHTLLGVLWAAGVYWLNPSFLWWLLPIVGALMLSIPLSVYTSRFGLGRRLRAARLFLIPEESRPPEEIRAMMRSIAAAPPPPGFVDAVVDPATNALACAAAVARFTRTERMQNHRLQKVDLALVEGPEALSAASKLRLLGDPIALSRLHWRVWTSPDAHPTWRNAIASPRRADAVVAPLPRHAVRGDVSSPAKV